MPSAPSVATKEKILSSAEKLFAEYGFSGTSLRVITEDARVNLASVNYHFGNKETLYIEVVRRRIRPINESRLVQLKRVVELAGNQPPPIELVMEALIQPAFEAHRDLSKGGPAITQIIARTFHEPLPFMEEVIMQDFQPTFSRFSQAVRQSIPQLAPNDFMWRMSFVIGAMHHTLAMIDKMESFTRGICKNHDYDGAQKRFIHHSAVVFLTNSRESHKPHTAY